MVRVFCGLRLTVDVPRVWPLHLGRSGKVNLPCEFAVQIEGPRKKNPAQVEETGRPHRFGGTAWHGLAFLPGLPRAVMPSIGPGP